MRILVSWLREFVDVDVSVQELADVLTMRGFEVSAVDPAPPMVQSAGEDAVLDLEITTNRPDCLSLIGIAREVSTVYDTDLRPPTTESGDVETGADAHAGDLTVTIEDPELCPRYAAAVADVTIGPSPPWLAGRLDATGVRPINNIVDITNYVMLETGHPMHAFDLNRLTEHTIKIRRAAQGETVRTLDGQDRPLRPDILVIADATRPQAVAGVMGGADSEVSPRTRLAAFESAYFLPTSVRRTSKRLALSTDASYRFERGADIDAPVRAMRRALTLLKQTGAGQIRSAIIDEYPHRRRPTTLTLRHARITRVLGVEIEAGFVVKTLRRLGFAVDPAAATRETENGGWEVTVPSHRVDVSREIDLIEEVARHHGYDRLPSTFPAAIQAPAPPAAWQQRQQLIRRVATAGGCSEAITYSFIERAAATPFVSAHDDLVGIANPLSEKFTVLRPSLLPGLIDSLIRNRRREHRDVRLFEIGKRFRRSIGETTGLALAVTGSGHAEHWSSADRAVDLFDLKGIVQQTCDALGVTPRFERTDHPVLVPGRAASIHAAPADGPSVQLGYLGQLLPALADERGFPNTGDEVYVAELDLLAVDTVATRRDDFRATPVPRYPSVVRDLALVVDRSLPAAAVRDTILTAAPDILTSVREFDRYAGKGVPEGRVSLAVHLTFRATDRTLTDAEVQASVDAVVAALKQEHGATLR